MPPQRRTPDLLRKFQRCTGRGTLAWHRGADRSAAIHRQWAIDRENLSRSGELTKGAWRRSRSGSDLVGAPGSEPRPNLDGHNVKGRGATGAVVIHASPRSRTCAQENARAPTAHGGCLDRLGVALRAICPPALTAEGDPAPVTPVSVSSLGWPNRMCWRRSPDRPGTRQFAARRSIDPTVRWRR